MQSWCAFSEAEKQWNGFCEEENETLNNKKKINLQKAQMLAKENNQVINASVYNILWQYLSNVSVQERVHNLLLSSLSCSLRCSKTNYCSNCPLLSTPLSLVCYDCCWFARDRINVVHIQGNDEPNFTATIITV